MARTRVVSFVLVLALLGSVALTVFAAGPNVVPNGVTAPPEEGIAAWLLEAWTWLRNVLDTTGLNVTPHS